MTAQRIIHLVDQSGRRAECNSLRATVGFKFAEYHAMRKEESAKGEGSVVRTCAKCEAAYQRRLAVAIAAKAAKAEAAK